MPLSEENKALIERVLGAITANEALNEDIFTTDEVIDLIEAARAEQRSKAEASLGGEGFSSSVDESAASVLTDLTDQQRGAPLEMYPVSKLLDALADAENDMESVASQHRPTAPGRHYCRGKAIGFRQAWELAIRFRHPSSEEQRGIPSEASSSCQARDEQGFSPPLPPPIREENQP